MKTYCQTAPFSYAFCGEVLPLLCLSYSTALSFSLRLSHSVTCRDMHCAAVCWACAWG